MVTLIRENCNDHIQCNDNQHVQYTLCVVLVEFVLSVTFHVYSILPVFWCLYHFHNRLMSVYAVCCGKILFLIVGCAYS